ncbi:CNIH4 protein, partial [Turnix velox]|nr:CNIH4 protein [Turnix velox]
IITLSDLECDYINARSCCSKLNKGPFRSSPTLTSFLPGQGLYKNTFWFFFSFSIFRYIMVPSGNMGVFDPTEIHNRGQLKSHMKEAMIKLGFHLLCFFMYLYRSVPGLICS